MKVERVGDLIRWTEALHHALGECLAHCADRHEDQRTRWLLSYLAERERALTQLVAGFIEHAENKILGTYIYDFVPHGLVNPHEQCDLPYAEMTFEQSEASVLEFHNEALRIYQYILDRAEIPEVRELVEHLHDMEEHETKLIAHQASRIRDL
jgi:hypothetical protein